MGIHVNPEVLVKQLDLCNCNERKDHVWHRMLLDRTLPQTVGGGIRQSHLVMLMLQLAYIDEA